MLERLVQRDFYNWTQNLQGAGFWEQKDETVQICRVR